jgi:PAS domain S-box-containing protein
MEGSFGVITDITEQKQADQVLRESEARYRLLADNVTDVIWTMDMNLRYTYISPSAERRLGYSVEESMAQSIENYLSPESVEVAIQAFTEELAIEELEQKDLYRSRTLELEQKSEDGSFVWSEARVTFIRDDNGKPIGILGVSRDITERKQMEEALRNSAETLQRAQHLAHVGSWTWNLRDNSFVLSEELRHIYGTDESEFSSIKDVINTLIHPDDRKGISEAAEEVIYKGSGGSLVYRIIRPDGEIRWMNATVPEVRQSDADGNPEVMVGAVQDITEQKLTEDALRESQGKLRTVFDSIGDGITVLDLTGNIIDVNDTVLRIKGYNREDVIGRFGLDFLPEKDHARAIEDMGALLDGKIEQTPFSEYLLLGKDGREIPCEASASLLRDGDGNVVGLISVERDLTEKKKAEQQLQESEERLRAFMESSTDLYTIWDSQLRLVDVSDKGVKAFLPGKTREEQIGKHIAEIVPEVMETGRYEEYVKVIETGEPFQVDETLIHPRFAKRHISIKAFKVQDGMGMIFSDITARKNTEEELRHYSERIRAMAKQLSEVEEDQRRLTARELHDNVGQNLTALGINLNIIKTKLEKARMEEDLNIVNDSQLLIEQTTESIRDVMANLRPPVLEDYGILATLKWYGQRFSSRTGTPITVQGEEPDPRLNADIEITLFRIYQEALTNISKHAKASTVIVSFNREDGRQRLLIADNGVGFDTSDLSKYAEQANWGLVTMSERADSIGASFQIESTLGRGTRVIVEI